MPKKNRMKNLTSYLDHLYELDYRERPVDVDTFLCDDNFLGKITKGGKLIYKRWRDELNFFLQEDTKTLIVLTGAIGTGKTNTAVIGITYVMHRILCLKDPWGFFNLSSGDKMAISFFNLTKTLGKSKGFELLQSFLLKSDWFLERAISVTGTQNRTVNFANFRYILSSPYAKGYGTVGEHVIIALMDEVDSPEESIKQKEKVLKAYESTVRRFESRFIINNESIGRFFLVASKQEEMSFLNTFIEEKKGSKNVHIADVPIWEAKPKTNYCGEKFAVSIGDPHTPPKIISSEEIQTAIENKIKVIWIPIEYLRSFEDDIIGSLRDIAGISIDQIRKNKLFPSDKLLRLCYNENKPNPVTVPEIVTGVRDPIDYITYIDLSKLKNPKHYPRFIHEDIAFSNDSVGLGLSVVKGYRIVDVEKEDGSFEKKKVKVIETELAVRIKASEGDQIPAFKVRKFVLDLKAAGLNISKFTADLRLASTDTFQILDRAGIKCEYLSLDRTPEAYEDFKNLVIERRWTACFWPFLHFELSNLEVDKTTRKVDHPEKVTDVVILREGGVREVVLKGSKDLADGVVGSVKSALTEGPQPIETEKVLEVLEKVKRNPSKQQEHIELIERLAGIKTKKIEIPEKVDTKKDFLTILNKVGKKGKK